MVEVESNSYSFERDEVDLTPANIIALDFRISEKTIA
ncbi:MAG: hypothetical protein ACI9YE_001241 [Psychroserpens sp.]|jgi:hypothetical protein